MVTYPRGDLGPGGLLVLWSGRGAGGVGLCSGGGDGMVGGGGGGGRGVFLIDRVLVSNMLTLLFPGGGEPVPGYGSRCLDTGPGAWIRFQVPGYGFRCLDTVQVPGYGSRCLDTVPGAWIRVQVPGYGSRCLDTVQVPGYGSSAWIRFQVPGYGFQAWIRVQVPGYGSRCLDTGSVPGYGGAEGVVEAMHRDLQHLPQGLQMNAYLQQHHAGLVHQRDALKHSDGDPLRLQLLHAAQLADQQGDGSAVRDGLRLSHCAHTQLLSSEVERDGLCVPRVVDLDVHLVVVLVLSDQRRLQTGHLVLLACSDELAGLLVVCVSGEGDVVDGHLERKLLTRHRADLIGLRHDYLSERPLHAVPGDDHSVPLVGAPALEQLAGQTTLHHAGGRHHHAGPDVADVLEHEGVVDVDGLADLVVHGVDVGLIHGHALPGQRGGVVDGDIMELRVVLPVLDEQQLLGAPQSEHGDEAAALSVHDVLHRVAEARLALLSLLNLMPATSFTSWKLMVSIFSMLSSRSVSVYSMSSAEMLLVDLTLTQWTNQNPVLCDDAAHLTLTQWTNQNPVLNSGVYRVMTLLT
ncbi:hypothetical protein F7725_028391 [Dissostichus mawsoni]|uniref:Uncharacterized protein n=1 Tax=Dissostichus mawsoni TaxID=36200 RepID=A0A7J5XG87_DISMA|nr:hypothetical protein F7725_028391 [Dissostichus mawsoni]